MKPIKALALSLSCIALLSGCGKEDKEIVIDTIVENPIIQETVENTVNTVKPLPSVIDINNLTDCTLPVDLLNLYFDEDSKELIMQVNLYEQELYDMVDISLLKVGDSIETDGNTIEIHSLETTDLGTILINGGLDVGGYELITTDNTVYYSIGYSDIKTYRNIGEVELVASDDFLYYDNSDLDKDGVIYNIDSIINSDTEIDYNGTRHNLAIEIVNGEVLSMTRSYIP